jgi:hypothetical protein
VSDPIAALTQLVDEGRRLRGSTEPVTPSDDFEAERDLGDIVDAVVWRPVEPPRVAWTDLQRLGELGLSPRLPDGGQLVAVVYVPDGRLLLHVRDDDDSGATVTEARFTGR